MIIRPFRRRFVRVLFTFVKWTAKLLLRLDAIRSTFVLWLKKPILSYRRKANNAREAIVHRRNLKAILQQEEGSTFKVTKLQNSDAYIFINRQTPNQVQLRVYLDSISRHLLGYLVFSNDEHGFVLRSIFVQKYFRQMQIGTLLLKHAFDVVRSSGIKTFEGIIETNKPEEYIPFFDKHNFHCSFDGYFLVVKKKMEDVIDRDAAD